MGTGFEAPAMRRERQISRRDSRSWGGSGPSVALAVAEDCHRGAELREPKLEPSGHQEEATGRPTSLSGSEPGIQPCYLVQLP